MNPEDKQIDEKKVFDINFDDEDKSKETPEKKEGEEGSDKKEPGEAQGAGEDKEQKKSEEPKKEDKAPAKEEPKKDTKLTDFPKKGENESDEAYNLRMQLKIAQDGRDTAKTEEEKSIFERKMDDLRKNLLEANKKPAKESPKEKEEVEDPSSEISEETLKKLGLVKKDEVEQIFSQKMLEIKRNEIIDGHQQAIQSFYKERPDIAANKEVKNFLEQYVIDLIKPDLNTTPKQLFETMKLVANAHFPKANRSEAAKNAQEKVDAMNIEANSKGTTKKTTVEDKEKEMLRSMGWSDDQIQSFG